MKISVLITTIVFFVVCILAFIWLFYWHRRIKKDYEDYLEEEYGEEDRK